MTYSLNSLNGLNKPNGLNSLNGLATLSKRFPWRDLHWKESGIFFKQKKSKNWKVWTDRNFFVRLTTESVKQIKNCISLSY